MLAWRSLWCLVLALALLLNNGRVVEAQGDNWDDDDESETPISHNAGVVETDDEFDEFVGGLPTQAPPAAPNIKVVDIPVVPAPPKPAAQIKQSPAIFSFIPLPSGWKGYEMEVFFSVVVALYVVNWVVGSIRNNALATQWGLSLKDVLQAQFSKVGGATLVVKESASCYRITATGRRNCIGLEARLLLRRRQDLASVLYSLFSSNFLPDRVTFEVALDAGVMDPLVFLMAGKSNIRSLKGSEAFADVDERPLPDSISAVDRLAIYAESPEVVDLIVAPSIAPLLVKAQHYIRHIHITDSNKRHESYKNVILMELRLPSPGQFDALVPLYELALRYVDALANAKLSSLAKRKAVERREELARKSNADEKEKLKEIREAKLEEKRKLEKQRLRSMSPEERAKEEERQRKRAQKKQTGKMKVILK